jgi:hypothetical protein
MQAKGCLNEAKIIGRKITDDSWRPRLVLEFEKMKARKIIKAIVFALTV